MRHLRLFENFDQDLKNSESIIFDWLPFDDQVNNPMNSSIPESLDLNGVMDFCKSNPEVGKVGLFIAHSKIPSGGFVRYVIKSTDPILMDSAVFGSNFEKLRENLDIDPTKVNLSGYAKGASVLGRLGILGEDE